MDACEDLQLQQAEESSVNGINGDNKWRVQKPGTESEVLREGAVVNAFADKDEDEDEDGMKHEANRAGFIVQ